MGLFTRRSLHPSPPPSPSPIAPPPPYPDASRSTATDPASSASLRPRHSTSSRPAIDDEEAGRDVGVTVRTNPEGTTTVVVDDPNLLAMFLEDYKRTKEYIRELEWKVAVRKALRRNLYKWYALAIIIITISVLLSTKHEDVVEFCRPVTKKIRGWPGGWLIPIALLVIVSFPPLVGHEVIGLLCGLVWGIGAGFGILAAGTFIGEIAVWVAFKWFCTARAARFEKKNKLYSSLTQLIREKSFMFQLVLRFSAVPGHITTAVSASAGASFWAYLAAAFLTLPKQLTIAYLGTAIGTHSRTNTIVSAVTTIATLIGTVIAAIYVYYQMRLVMRRQPTVIPCLPTTMQEAQALTLDLSDSTMGRRATVAAIKSAPHDKDTAYDLYADLHDRKPWLLGGRTMDDRGLGRARSLPGPLSDDFVKRLSDINRGDAMDYADKAEDGNVQIRLEVVPDQDLPSTSTFSSRVGTPGLKDARRPLLGHLDSHADSSYSPRGTMSLDIPRDPLDRLGGREIADDADMFAMSRGARRPDYGRTRGESRAALLGRPDWDDRSEAGSERGKSVYKDRPMELAEANKDDSLRPESAAGLEPSKEKVYGRPRGESGAALLGRPDEDA